MQVPNIPAPTPVLPTLPAPPLPVTGPAFGARLTALLGAATPTGGASAGAPSGARPTANLGAAASGAVTLGAMLRASTGGPAAPATLLGGLSSIAAVTGPATHRGHGHAIDDGPFAGHVATVAPVAGELTSAFGERVHPISGVRRDHHGLDIAAPTGTPVRSVTGGTVIAAGDRGGYGLTVEVDHGNGTTSRYAHLSAIDVEVGDQLPVGGTLGAVGSTGASTGPHLHVEVRVHGEPVDPHGLW